MSSSRAISLLERPVATCCSTARSRGVNGDANGAFAIACRARGRVRLRRAGVRRPRDDVLEDVGGVDLVFDLIGGDIGKRSARLVRTGGTLVSIVGPSEARPADALAVDFVVESDRAQMGEIVQRVRDGRLRTNIGTASTLNDAVAAFNPTERRPGKTRKKARASTRGPG
jgi:NADPH:quinone reductase-like Zn-dependent oxidoreductase